MSFQRKLMRLTGFMPFPAEATFCLSSNSLGSFNCRQVMLQPSTLPGSGCHRSLLEISFQQRYHGSHNAWSQAAKQYRKSYRIICFFLLVVRAQLLFKLTLTRVLVRSSCYDCMYNVLRATNAASSIPISSSNRSLRQMLLSSS